MSSLNSGNWFLDLKNGEGSVGAAESSEVEADTVMKSTSSDLVAMFTGKLSPTMAFMGGKLKISGNIGAAMKLEKLMAAIIEHIVYNYGNGNGSSLHHIKKHINSY